MFEYNGRARSVRSLVIGDKGLLSSNSIAIHFAAGTPVPEFERGASYVVTIERAEDHVARIAGAAKATKAELLEMVVGNGEDNAGDAQTDS